MYVQWLLEFVWRIFVQGPLLFIDFLTGDNFKTGGIFSFNLSYTTNANHFIGYLSFPIFMGIALIVLFCCFLLRIAHITATSKEMTTKYEIIQTIKKSIIFCCIILMISLILPVVLIIMDQINVAIFKAMNTYYKDIFINHPQSNLSHYVYATLISTNYPGNQDGGIWIQVDKAYAAHFFYPEHFSIIGENAKGNTTNFIISIIFVIMISWFLVWMVWNVTQKMIEIVFLMYGLPFAMSTSLGEITDLRWKIWINEILNKIIIFILLLVMYRIFVYMYVDTYNIIYVGNIKDQVNNNYASNTNNSLQNDDSILKPIQPRINMLYFMFFIELAIGSSIMFITKFISSRNFEHIGIWSSIKSFKQTSDFINNYKNTNYINLNWDKQPLEDNNEINKINDNIELLRESLTNSIENKGIYNDIERVKIFDK